MAQVAAGQPEAMTGLFERHHRPLYGFLLRMTGHPAAAEDLVQEAFLRVLRHAATFDARSPFRPWLYRIARNLLADHHSRRGREPLAPLEAAELHDEGADPHAHAEARQDHARLETALARLSFEQRELLLLSRDPDLSYTELAALYGCSAGALKVRVHRALQALRAQFHGDGEVSG
ncbi:MAG TPA: RNA polymerase sigma factor [Holophaga sp.]|nr:RNA polymerase sigma factor [Holophaga sp.]